MDAQNYKNLSPKIFDFRKIKNPRKNVNPRNFIHCFIEKNMLED